MVNGRACASEMKSAPLHQKASGGGVFFIAAAAQFVAAFLVHARPMVKTVICPFHMIRPQLILPLEIMVCQLMW